MTFSEGEVEIIPANELSGDDPLARVTQRFFLHESLAGVSVNPDGRVLVTRSASGVCVLRPATLATARRHISPPNFERDTTGRGLPQLATPGSICDICLEGPEDDDDDDFRPLLQPCIAAGRECNFNVHLGCVIRWKALCRERGSAPLCPGCQQPW